MQETWCLNETCCLHRTDGIFEMLLSPWFSDIGNLVNSGGSKSPPSPHWREESNWPPGVLRLCDATSRPSALAFRESQGSGRAKDTGSRQAHCRSLCSWNFVFALFFPRRTTRWLILIIGNFMDKVITQSRQVYLCGCLILESNLLFLLLSSHFATLYIHSYICTSVDAFLLYGPTWYESCLIAS